MPAEELRAVASDYVGHMGDEEAQNSPEDEEGERELRLCVVGMSRDPSLDRVAEFLSNRYGVAITVVTFEPYNLGTGERVLVRQLTEVENAVAGSRKWRAQTVEALVAEAEARGIGVQFRALPEVVAHHGLYLRPWKRSVMVTPPGNRSRMLHTVRSCPVSQNRIRLWLGPDTLVEFYPPLTEEEVIGQLGEGGKRTLSPDGVERFVSGLDRLFARIPTSAERSQED